MEDTRGSNRPRALPPPSSDVVRRLTGEPRDWAAGAAPLLPWRVLVFISLRARPARRHATPHLARVARAARARAVRHRTSWAAERERRTGRRRFLAIAALLTLISILGMSMTDADDAGPGSAEGVGAFQAGRSAPGGPLLTVSLPSRT
jgi:hypothetical protein